IIALTAHAMAGDAERYLAAGMDGYISKPIRSKRLREEIERFASKESWEQVMEKRPKIEMEPALNIPELLNRVDNDKELLRELLLIFKDDSPLHINALREATGKGDLKAVTISAHTMRGMLANLAADRAAAAATRLEQVGRDGDATGVRAALGEFEQEVAV